MGALAKTSCFCFRASRDFRGTGRDLQDPYNVPWESSIAWFMGFVWAILVEFR